MKKILIVILVIMLLTPVIVYSQDVITPIQEQVNIIRSALVAFILLYEYDETIRGWEMRELELRVDYLERRLRKLEEPIIREQDKMKG